MKIIILLLITVGSVIGGQCPPREDITPCKCEYVRWSWYWKITCYSIVNHISYL